MTTDQPIGAGAGPPAEARPLVGFTIGITSDRRREELAALLERRGARVVLAPALRIVPIPDDSVLLANTTELVRRPPTIVVATTGIGFRGWLEAAEEWGVAEPLKGALGQGYLIARGPKARGAIRAAGLTDGWSPESECCEEVLAHLLRRGVAGERIAVQMHGNDQSEFVDALRGAGASVIEAAVYRWMPPTDATPLRRLVDLVTGRLVDAVTFTSAPAVDALLRAAADPDAVVEALRTDVLAACVGPVTAEPLVRRGVPVAVPGRARLGALARMIVDELPGRATTLRVNGTPITLRGHAAIVDNQVRPLAHAPMAMLRALVEARGGVLTRAQLLTTLPRGADEHAVEMAVARLRVALGGSGYVQTVIKRGYRLCVDPPA